MTSNSLKKPEKSLPFHWYYDSKVFQKEIDKIFNDEWIYVCHINSIEKNHYRTLNINNKNRSKYTFRDDKRNLEKKKNFSFLKQWVGDNFF